MYRVTVYSENAAISCGADSKPGLIDNKKFSQYQLDGKAPYGGMVLDIIAQPMKYLLLLFHSAAQFLFCGKN